MADENTKFLNRLEGKTDEPAPQEDKIQYSCHPTQKYKVGRFVFENSVLTLDDEEDEKEFLSVINSKKFPERERNQIKKLDFAAAQALVKEHLAKKGGTTQQFDSSIGERASEAPRVGVGDLLKGGGSGKPAATAPAESKE